VGPTIAFVIFTAGIAGLFFLNRDSSVRTSKALWLAVIWMWINGSRSVSDWLGTGYQTSNGLPATSPLDQLIAGLLVLFGVIVLAGRKDIIRVLFRSWPIVLFFFYGLVSLLWSDFSEWGLKRWIRALGELVMVMIVVTDAHPVDALKRFFSRVGFILLPYSYYLIKYSPLGRGFDQWGFAMNTGVTTNKNTLGVITFVIALGTTWQVLQLFRDKQRPNRARHLLAQSTLLCFGVALLFMAHSATSGASFTLGAGLLVATSLPLTRIRPIAVHVIVLVILIGGGLTLFLGGEGAAAEALGRNPDLTGRTQVWDALIPLQPNVFVGAGFETFWLGSRVATMRRTFTGINEAHDGYLETYLNLGLVGVGLILLILTQGYFSAVAAFRRDPEFGSLLVASILAVAIYSITEAGFRMLDPAWFLLLLSIMAAGRAAMTGKSMLRAPHAPIRPGSGRSAALPQRTASSSERQSRWGLAARTS
jgi:exopolysaccharide production protein ExoQ